jgi:hypothetical protein
MLLFKVRDLCRRPNLGSQRWLKRKLTDRNTVNDPSAYDRRALNLNSRAPNSTSRLVFRVDLHGAAM